MAELARAANTLLSGCLTGLGVVLYALGLARVVIALRRRSPRVLMYHACEPEESGFTRGLSINTPPSRFESQLEFLSRHYRVVPLDALREGPVPDRAAVITFDDGYRSVHEHAFPRLKARGFPATVFLVSETIDNSGMIWLNALGWFLDRDGGEARSLIADRLRLSRSGSWSRFLDGLIGGYEPESMAGLIELLGARLGGSAHDAARADRLYLGKAELAEMARHRITFGNHTASHPNLGRLSADAQHAEIARAKRTLDELDGSIAAFAHPFGIFDEATIAIATELEYSMLMEVKGDNRPLDLLHVARVNVTSDSPAILFARLELVYPIKAILRRMASSVACRCRRLRPGGSVVRRAR